MKLCIITHSVIKGDGQGRVNYEVAWEAIRRGHHVTLLASKVAPELLHSSQINWIFIPVKGCPTEFFRNMVFAWQSTNWLDKHRFEHDLVKVNGAITWAEGDVNAVHFVHNSWLRSPVHISRIRRDFYGFYQWLYTALNARWEKQAFRQAKVVVAVSEKVAQELVDIVAQELVDIGVPRSDIRVIVNGVDLQEFSPGAAERQKSGLPCNVILALFVGDLCSNRKNLDTVLHALVQVPDVHLAVVGRTEDSPYLQMAESLKLSEQVHFLGYRHDVPEIMQAVDLLIFPSRYEPFGLVVLEAMASGLPVITAATTGAADLVKPECGVVLPEPDDTDALVQALIILKNNCQLRQQMGQAGQFVAEQHSWTSIKQS